MTPLRMTLKASGGHEVSLRVGKSAGWPDGARMDWVRFVDGKPEIVTATLALEWRPAEEQDGSLFVPKPGTMRCAVDWDHSEPWAGDAPSFWALDDLLANALSEWSDTFCAEVNKALDPSSLTAFADLHWHELEAARKWASLDRNERPASGVRLEDGEGLNTAGEAALALRVRRILDDTNGAAAKRAAVQYEAEGGRLETEPRAGNEAWKPSVPVEVAREVTGVDCACRTRLRYGSRPDPKCPHCRGSGSVPAGSVHAKDWANEPEDPEA